MIPNTDDYQLEQTEAAPVQPLGKMPKPGGWRQNATDHTADMLTTGVGISKVTPDSHAETVAPSAEEGASETKGNTDGQGESKTTTDGQGESKTTTTTTSKVEMPAAFSAEKFKQDKPGMDEIMRMMGYEAAPTPEQLEAQRKKKKREAVFAAIGDGIAAIAGMFGGVNMYNPEKGQLAAHKSRWDKLEAEQRENRDKYFRTYMDIYGMKNTDAWKQYTQQHTEAREEKQDKRADEQLAIAKARQEREDAKAKLYNDYMQGRIDEQNYKTLIAGIDAGDRTALNKAKMYSLTHKGSGGRGGGSTRYYGIIDGVAYKTKADYDKAAVDYAQAYGVDIMKNIDSESTSKSNTGRVKGQINTSHQTRKTPAELVSDTDRKRQGGNGAGSDSNWKSRSQRVGGSGSSGGSTGGSYKLNFG